MNVETIDEGRVTVATEFLPLLRANGLDSFERVMTRQGGRVIRDFPGRRTFRLELTTPQGTSQAVYLKRYEAGYLSLGQALLRRLRWPGADDEALREWNCIQSVRALGINTAKPVAIGQQRSGGQVTRSFLMTAEIAGAIEGHTFVESLSAAPRRRLFRRVGLLSRQFHQAGFVHKDYYLGHILVAPAVDEPELFLIDLQRAVRPCCFRERWLVKDLGALAFSAWRAGATRTDLICLFLTYCGTRKLGSKEKRLARRIVRRVAWLRTHRPKHDGDFDPSAEPRRKA